MIDLQWLEDQLCAVLRWQLANPGQADKPDAPQLPFAGRRVWHIFLALHETRGVGMGSAAITHSDLLSYATFNREPIRPWEATIIRALDGAFLKTLKADGEETKPAGRPLSPALFDALIQGKQR